MSEATEKLKGWTPQKEPPEELKRELRQLAKRAVYGLWHEKRELLGHEPKDLSLYEIDLKVQSIIASLDSEGKWKWGDLTVRTIDRRINEAACKKYAHEFVDGITPIVAAKAGRYKPNPRRFIQC